MDDIVVPRVGGYQAFQVGIYGRADARPSAARAKTLAALVYAAAESSPPARAPSLYRVWKCGPSLRGCTFLVHGQVPTCE